MAANTRTAIKWVRDLAKSHYKKDTQCAICGVEHELEFHHYNTVSLVLKNYAEVHGLHLESKEEILAMREKFIKDNWYEMVEDAVTLCADHHKLLHKLYGKEPELHTASKQKSWVEKQRNKRLNPSHSSELELQKVTTLPASLTRFCTDSKPFSKFLTR